VLAIFEIVVYNDNYQVTQRKQNKNKIIYSSIGNG